MKRITSIPGVTVLPFWQAPKYSPGTMREVRAITWHFAQGGGTDTWLTRQDGAQGNNSCHIVLKYSGAIRQIVEFDDSSWSLHISYDSDTNDAPDYGIFGLRHVKDALGDGWADPNRYIIAIEIEGFYQDGPNGAQKATMLRLAQFLEGEFPKAVHLGHRDFQDYKPCPGPTPFKNLLPHAGRLGTATPTEETPMLDFYPTTGGDGTVTLKDGRGLVNLVTGDPIIPTDTVKTSHCRIHLAEPFGDGDNRQDGYLVRHAGQAHVALDDVVESFVATPIPTIDPDPTLQAALTEAQADLAAIAAIVNEAA